MKHSMINKNGAHSPSKELSFIWKLVFLSFFGGISFVGLFFIPELVSKFTSSTSNLADFFWHGATEMFVLFWLGAFFSAIFGAPGLHMVDRCFPRRNSRYVLGGVASAAAAWLITIVPLFLFRDFPGRVDQIALVPIFLGIYIFLGVIVGVGLSFIVWIFEKFASASV